MAAHTGAFYIVRALLAPKDQYPCRARLYSPTSWEFNALKRPLFYQVRQKASWLVGVPLIPAFCWDWEKLYQGARLWCQLKNGGTSMGSCSVYPPSKPYTVFIRSPVLWQSGFKCLEHWSSLSLDRLRSQQLGNPLPKASSHIAFASFLSSGYSCSNCLSLKDYFFNAFFFSPQSGTCFANDYWTLALYLGNFKIIKNSPINVLQTSVKLLILNFSHSLKKVQEMIFPNLWPSLLARFIYTWSQTPEVIIVPGKEKKGKETHFMRSFIG